MFVCGYLCGVNDFGKKQSNKENHGNCTAFKLMPESMAMQRFRKIEPF